MKKRRIMNKIILLICLCLTLTLCSCGGNMTDESVRQELERLLPLSYEMNEIFWGEGLPLKESTSGLKYVPVADDCQFSSTEEILQKASEVFSKDYLENIKEALFTDTDDIDPRYIDTDGLLKGDKTNKGFDIQSNVVIESAVIKKQNRGTVIVTVEHEDGGKNEITLVLQDGKWYIDSPTY
ncbi:MAG: hypothetical protein E7593_03645 [Ruminococcaceae bacterium]|nr:hypothetical protein [Oscillospiraceae bacterium]